MDTKLGLASKEGIITAMQHIQFKSFSDVSKTLNTSFSHTTNVKISSLISFEIIKK